MPASAGPPEKQGDHLKKIWSLQADAHSRKTMAYCIVSANKGISKASHEEQGQSLRRSSQNMHLQWQVRHTPRVAAKAP